MTGPACQEARGHVEKREKKGWGEEEGGVGKGEGEGNSLVGEV